MADDESTATKTEGETDGSARPDDAPPQDAEPELPPPPTTTPAPKRRDRNHRRQRSGRIAIVIAVISLVLTGVQSFYTGSQVSLSKQQLEEARHQFTDAGPKLTVTTRLVAYDAVTPSVGLNFPGDKDQTVTASMLEPYDSVFFFVFVANSGRSATSISLVTILNSINSPIIAGASNQSGYVVSCRNGGESAFTDCGTFLPRKLDQGDTIMLLFPLKPLLGSIAQSRVDSGGIDVTIDAPAMSSTPAQYHFNTHIEP